MVSILGLNMVQLLGRVGSDPVLRGESKSKFVTFEIATNQYFPDKKSDGTDGPGGGKTFIFLCQGY